MNIDKIINNIAYFFRKNNQVFFNYAWREKINNILTTESKYSKLIDWINNEIENERINLNVFNPADKTKTYSNSVFKKYTDSCQNIALLLNAKYIILDKDCTTEMRDNWEYTLCKMFKIKFNEELNCFTGVME